MFCCGRATKKRATAGRPLAEIHRARFVPLRAAERPLVARCLRLAREWGDGPGTDTGVQPGTRFAEVPANQGAFPRRWRRRGEPPRGDALWIIPKGADPSRRLLFLHGGGYIGMAPTETLYQSVASRLAHHTRLCVLSIDYRLGPEHKCPAAVEDALAALQWLSDHGPPPRDGRIASRGMATALFVAGDSSGGGLTLAAALAAPPRLRRRIDGLVGISPWTDLTCSGESYESRLWDPRAKTGDPYYTRDDSLGIASNYAGPGTSPSTNPLASPLCATPRQLRALPPVLLLVGDYEVSSDDATVFHRRLLEAGHRDAACSVYEQMWHCHTSYTEGFGLAPLPQAKRGLREIGRWVASHSATQSLTRS